MSVNDGAGKRGRLADARASFVGLCCGLRPASHSSIYGVSRFIEGECGGRIYCLFSKL